MWGLGTGGDSAHVSACKFVPGVYNSTVLTLYQNHDNRVIVPAHLGLSGCNHSTALPFLKCVVSLALVF